VASERPSVLNTEMKEEKKSENSTNMHVAQSLSPERKSKVENAESVIEKKERVEEEKTHIIEDKRPSKSKRTKTLEPPSGLMIENANPSSHRNMESSLNEVYEIEKKQLPAIKVNSNKNYEAHMKVEASNYKKDRKYNHSLERDYNRQRLINEIGLSQSNSNGNIHGSNHGSNQKLIKILPYVYNEHISNVVYKNNQYQNPSVNNKHDKKSYLKNYDYKSPRKANLDSSLNNGKLPIIPNRKLSPIRKQYH